MRWGALPTASSRTRVVRGRLQRLLCAPMGYRDNASPAEEVIETFSVSTAKGAALLGCLLAGALFCAVAWVVSVFVGTPAELEGREWSFGVGLVVFAAPALWLRQKRKRTLSFVRTGDTVRLVVPGVVELTFPLSLSGSQAALRINGATMHHVHLKLVDSAGRGVFLKEVRGAAYGAQKDWFDTVDRTAAAESFDIDRRDDASRIRQRVEALNGGAHRANAS